MVNYNKEDNSKDVSTTRINRAVIFLELVIYGKEIVKI